jgi:hypothetical protein
MPNRLPRAIAAALAGLLALAVPAAARDAGPDGPVVLTVTGVVDRANRPPMDPFEDILFNVLNESFDQAFAFTRADLSDMPQFEVTAEYEGWPGPVTVGGPRLLDVLTKAGARGDRVVVQAVDGYTVEFETEEVTRDFVLALQMEGEPLDFGGRGPVWLVFPPDSYAGQDNSTDAALPWGVFHIKVLAAEALE